MNTDKKKLLVIMSAGWVLASVCLGSNLPDARAGSGPVPPLYVQDKQQELRSQSDQLAAGMLTTSGEDASLHELIRILRTTRYAYDAINHYIYGWQSIMNYQYQANLDAVRKGIAVSRTFIIAEEILKEPVLCEGLIATMEKQHRDGIRVRYGFQHELDTVPAYQPYKYIDAGLSDGVVFARVTAVSSCGPQPENVEILWDPVQIAPLNPFPFLKKSKQIYLFDKNAADRIRKTAGQLTE